MRKPFGALVAGALVVALSIGTGASIASGSAASGRGNADEKGPKVHDVETALGKRERELRAKALEMKLHGKVGKNEKVVKVAPGQYVQLAREKTERVFVVIAEFGNTRHAAYPDTAAGCLPAPNLCFPGDGSAQRYNGPLHNEIPQPDRSLDNTTLWKADYNKGHYEDMYFNRMAKYYESQSSGRYSVNGDVTEWVKVPFNEARYGRNFCGGIVCNNTWFLIRDAMAFWVKGQLDSGKTMAQVNEYLSTFDVWDRYDIDGDSNFDEPDGVIDHFQIVHAGGDEAAGDPLYGTDAIWSHRWAAQVGGRACPFNAFEVNSTRIGQGGLSSGQTIPENLTNYCVYDYTIQPENGGLGVFAHEYGHDLGLPDLYDTSGNTGGAENSTGFWTLMSSGANIGDGGPNGIGDAPTDLGAWEKFQLGWLNYEVAFAGAKSEHKLGPAESNTKQAQGLFVVLPDKQVDVDLGDPADGATFFFSGAGDNLDNTMTKSVTVGAGAFIAKARYDIETDFDYAYLTVNGNPVETNLSTDADPNGENHGNGITGTTGGNWVNLTANLAAFSGQTVTVGFEYVTDGGVVESGFQVDAITLDGVKHDTGWTFDGFSETDGLETSFHFNAYLAENRQYVGYDTSLATAYNFGFLNTKPDWVESFRYQNGILISYWDTSQTDNNVGDHPGSGLILPVDANTTFHNWVNGDLLRPRILSYDSTFGLEPKEAITVHRNGEAVTIPAGPAQPVFDDTKTYWSGAAVPGRFQPGWVGVNVPKTGTVIRVKSMSSTGFAQVQVSSK